MSPQMKDAIVWILFHIAIYGPLSWFLYKIRFFENIGQHFTFNERREKTKSPPEHPMNS